MHVIQWMTSRRCSTRFGSGVAALACAGLLIGPAAVANPGSIPVSVAQSAPMRATTATLYARLGGADGVRDIASSLVDEVANDPLIGRSFKDTNLERIKRLLGEQLCELAGGPCRYSGDPMRESHAGQHISEAEFYGMVAALERILERRHVPAGATNELLRLLAPMKRDIVEPPAPGKR
jgi:hemoglobin